VGSEPKLLDAPPQAQRGETHSKSSRQEKGVTLEFSGEPFSTALNTGDNFLKKTTESGHFWGVSGCLENQLFPSFSISGVLTQKSQHILYL